MQVGPGRRIPYDYLSTDDDFETLINGEPAAEDSDRIRNWVIEGGHRGDRCPYCRRAVKLQTYERRSADDGSSCYADLAECPNCAYWQFFLNRFKDESFPSWAGWDAWLSKLRQFDEVPPECSAELAQTIRRNPDAWHTMEPRLLERFVADVFSANYARAEVFHVGRPADGGVDILFLDAGVKCLVQVKRRGHWKRGEGVVVIRNLLGAMLLEDSLRGIVVSTADHFTYRAYEAVGRAAERGMTIELVDRGKLNRMLDPLLPKDPWRHVIREFSPQLYRNFGRRQGRQSSEPRVRGRNPSEGAQMRLFADDDK